MSEMLFFFMLLAIPVEISDEQQLKSKSVQRCELMQIQTR